MTRRTKLLSLGLVMMLLLLGASVTWAMSGWECLDTQTCHLLMYDTSDIYVLCANGVLTLEKNGVDSWRVICGARYRTMAPIVYKGE